MSLNFKFNVSLFYAIIPIYLNQETKLFDLNHDEIFVAFIFEHS